MNRLCVRRVTDEPGRFHADLADACAGAVPEGWRTLGPVSAGGYIGMAYRLPDGRAILRHEDGVVQPLGGKQ